MRGVLPTRRGGLAAVLAGLVAACEPVPPPAVPAGVPPAPVRPAARPEVPPPATASAASRALAEHYARIERQLLAQGLLRTDGGGPDTPFTARMLAENFLRIALYDEYVAAGGVMVQRATEARLRRWEAPIRMRLSFSASVPEATRAADRAEVARLAARITRQTGLPITLAEDRANFDVLILDDDDRRGAGPRLRSLVPGISDGAVATVTGLDRGTFCLVFAFSDPGSHAYNRAVAVIRAEHPPLMRRSCLHEEIAQAMGLANDSPAARPSIFNDDEEFALLTTHDELLLRILYDRRLRPGMTAAEARPIVQRIAEELVGGES